MIEFLKDYQTRALPPETFKAGDQVKRSDDSELYFVRLGVAGFVTDGGLVDQDHLPVHLAPVAQAVTPGDRRVGIGGRAGELSLGLDAPQRASTGPGSDALLGGDQQTAAIAGEIERLTAELAAANGEGDDLAMKLRQAEDAHRAELAAHGATRDELVRIKTDLAAAENGRAEAEAAAAELRAQVATLEGQLGDVTKAAAEGQQGGETATKKTGK